jgi:hypothetical protein
VTVEELRQEQTTPKWRSAVFKHKGKKCAVCEAKEDLEIHHVLPLVKGGTNDMSNLLVVCQEHHKQLHGKIHKRTANNGRKRITTYEESIPVLKMYFNKEIGNKECCTLLGYATTNHSCSLFEYRKKYRDQYGVPKDFYNNIDLKESKAR